jgi:predicted transcriptional regulator
VHLSDAEWRVMSEVWKHTSTTARDVHTALAGETGWAYSTVKTMMTRLAEKGALESERDGKQNVFRAAVTRESARALATSTLVERVFDGALGGLFQHLLGGRRLSKKDLATVQELLAEQEKRR